jgi:hypothetical protein
VQGGQLVPLRGTSPIASGDTILVSVTRCLRGARPWTRVGWPVIRTRRRRAKVGEPRRNRTVNPTAKRAHAVLDFTAMQSTSILLLVALAAAVQGNTPPAESGFTSLFNAKDLTGWRIAGSPESFTVSDGAIVASGPASHAYYDGSFRNHRFRNFELRVDVMARGGANGGVYVLTEFEQVGGNERASGRFPSKGFEIQVYNGTGGPPTGSLYHVVDLDESPVKDEEWFTQTIIVKDDTIAVKINEKQVVNWRQPADWNGGREGPGRRITGPGTIALQAHDPKSAVLYKNIRIKPLD